MEGGEVKKGSLGTRCLTYIGKGRSIREEARGHHGDKLGRRGTVQGRVACMLVASWRERPGARMGKAWAVAKPLALSKTVGGDGALARLRKARVPDVASWAKQCWPGALEKKPARGSHRSVRRVKR